LLSLYGHRRTESPESAGSLRFTIEFNLRRIQPSNGLDPLSQRPRAHNRLRLRVKYLQTPVTILETRATRTGETDVISGRKPLPSLAPLRLGPRVTPVRASNSVLSS
jgi:hypothetical protein